MPVDLRDHDPSWVELASAAVRELADALPGLLDHAEHIGSTAVPGLLAKPVIDVLTATSSLQAFAEASGTVLALGYEPVASGMPARLFYRRVREGRWTHLHVVTTASWPTRNERLLRDHLRAHPDDVARYAAVKRELAGLDRADYTRAKTPIVQQLVDRARADRGLPLVPVWEA